MSALLDLMRATSALSGGNAAFIEDLYEQYLADPSSVDAEWRAKFDEIRPEQTVDTPHGPVRDRFAQLARESHHRRAVCGGQMDALAAEKQAAVLRLINAYRVRGHEMAKLDPLELEAIESVPDLSPTFHQLTSGDMEQTFNTGSLFAADQMKLKDIIELVKEVYTGTIGSQYMHIVDTDQKRWIQKRLETYRGRPEMDTEQRKWLLKMLTAAEGLEKYLHTRYVGQKRFSLEGGESLIPMMDELIQRAGAKGMEQIVIGMAHRGRLNVLSNILGKKPAEIFDEFEGRKEANSLMQSGDVKYHMGFSSDVTTPGGHVHVALGFNPSHLEIISPVIQGSVRARQHREGDLTGDKVLPIVIHGDSAFAGQGVVMETFNMSQTRGFTTGGTVHIIINNQVGFTTSNPQDTRSTRYCSDVAKMVEAPIFHVNGDDPEAVIFVTRLALDYRNQFHRDVVIDLVCYRRHGHNEADEPAVTQPIMYNKVRRHPTTRQIYADRLISQGVIAPDDASGLVENCRDCLDQGKAIGREVLEGLLNKYKRDWTPYQNASWNDPVDTSITLEKLQELAASLQKLPEGFKLHPRVARIMSDREKMANGDKLLDWGMGETLAYASLVDAGKPVRLCGQDSGRGTFFHRHAVVHNQLAREDYCPLRHVREGQADFTVIDSVLSEEAVLAFEYGYATTEPESLVIWEAQFGDFANGAQVVIDQFISAAGTKWGLFCGLTMLLPHGYEGQGAEHSSARLERYMQLCAEHNMQVCVPTTPSQIFHLLRRQMLRPFRRPLVVMSPKSLLRHQLATSPLEDFTTSGSYRPVIGEIDDLDPAEVTQVIMCSGKVYYELLEARRARGIRNVAIIRIEQLYPFPKQGFHEALAPFSNADTLVWCQEEPQNQGAWDQIKHRFHRQLDAGRQLYFVGRPASATSAVGYPKLHRAQQETLIDEALTGRFNPSMNTRI